MDTNTSAKSITAAATACQIASGAYHCGSCSLVAQGHFCPCSENRLVKPCLSRLLGTVESLQQEVLRMRVSHDDKGSNAEVQPSKPPQEIHIFIPNSSYLLLRGTAVTGLKGPSDPCSNTIPCEYGLSGVSLNPEHMVILSSHRSGIYYYTWSPRLGWQNRGPIYSLTTCAKPTVIQTSHRGFELFYVSSSDYTIWHQTGTVKGEWSVRSCLGDQKCHTSSTPVAVSRDYNLVDLFFVGPDNDLHWKSWADMQWKPPRPSYVKLGENCAHLGAAARHRNRIDLFALSLEGGLLHKSWNGRDWEPSDLGFRNLGGSFASRPAVVSRSPERLDLFMIGKDSRLYHKALDKSIWKPATGFLDLGGNFNGAIPPAVVWSRDGMEIFMVGGADTERELYHKRWDGVGDPLFSEFEPMFNWGCTLQPAVVVLDSTK